MFGRTRSGWTQEGEKLTGAGEIGEPHFGDSVALSANGNTALIGGPGDNPVTQEFGGDLGAAWVFTRTGSNWTQQGEKLTGQGETGGGYFGQSVALSANGNRALIGAPGHADGLGAVWQLTRKRSAWTESSEKLNGEGEIGRGFFGSVALSADGRVALIGAPGDDSFDGAAWVFGALEDGQR